MEVIGTALMVIGGIMVLIGSLWLLLVAFQEGILWGLGCIILPFVSLIFLVMHWDVARRPFFVQLAGLVPVFLGGVLMES